MSDLPKDRTLPPAAVGLIRGYNRCLELEAESRDVQPPRSGPSDLICIRILGYLILYGPEDRARATVAKEVMSCNLAKEVVALGKFYYNHFLRPFKAAKGHTPKPSRYISRPSFDTLKDAIQAMLVESPQSHQSAKQKALIRDRFRCVVTGRLDKSALKIKQVVDEAKAERGSSQLDVDVTFCAHIFDEPTNLNISGSSEGSAKHEYAASVWAVMDRFGYASLRDELNGPGVHSLKNTLTLNGLMHRMFDELELAFEATEKPNEYKVCTYPTPLAHDLGLPRVVAFKAADEANEECSILPSPIYLRIHAACAKIAHLSGAGEHIDQVLRDLEDIVVLAEDGVSAEVLDYAIMRNQIKVF